MRKYQLRKWPFLVVLFTGLTCPACIFEDATEMKGAKVLQQEKSIIEKGEGGRYKTENYPFGPQFLVLIP
jgi:hypothetical protein